MKGGLQRSLLWLVQRARQRCTPSDPFRPRVLEAAEKYRSKVEGVEALDGLRSFVEVTDNPWRVLMHHVEVACGIARQPAGVAS